MQPSSNLARKPRQPRRASFGPAVAASPATLVHDARAAALREAESGRVGEGLLMLEQVLSKEPDSHAVHSDIASLLLMARQHELAAHYALEALERRPNHGPSLYVLGFALSALGDKERARIALSQLLEGEARVSLLEEAPPLMRLVHIELDRLNRET